MRFFSHDLISRYDRKGLNLSKRTEPEYLKPRLCFVPAEKQRNCPQMTNDVKKRGNVIFCKKQCSKLAKVCK